VMGQHTHQHTHLEVLRIHMQLVTVQLTELGKGALEVVQVIQAITKGTKHFLAMSLHLRVAHNSSRRGQIPKGIKEPLGPRVDHQQPKGGKIGLTTNFIHVHFAPQGGNGILLLRSQMHHGVCLRLLVNTVVSEASVSNRWLCPDFYAQPWLLPSLLLGVDWPTVGCGSTG
uniref:Uncharacterized protein n=1 Tax=Theropithecus gelada TaxID=9565 RepID=A0A8D2FZV8_THEGE